MIPRAQYRELELVFRSALRNELAPVLAEIVLLRERVEGLIDRRRFAPDAIANLASLDDATVRVIAQSVLEARPATTAEPEAVPDQAESRVTDAPTAEVPTPAAIFAALPAPAAVSGSRRRYTDEEVRKVKRVFLETGSPARTADRLGIPVNTVNSMRISKRWDALELPTIEVLAEPPAAAIAPAASVPPGPSAATSFLLPTPAKPVSPASVPDAEATIDDAQLRLLWPDPAVRRMDIAERLGVKIAQVDRRAQELNLGPRPLGGTPPVPMPPPDRKALEAVPGSAEDARDWLFAQLKRERKSEAEIEMMMEQASVKTIFAACNVRRVKLGLPPYVQLERSA